MLSFDIQNLPHSIPLVLMVCPIEYELKYTDWEKLCDVITPMGTPSAVWDTVYSSNHGESINRELLLVKPQLVKHTTVPLVPAGRNHYSRLSLVFSNDIKIPRLAPSGSLKYVI